MDGALVIGKLDRFGVGKHGIALLHAGVVGHDVVEPIAHAGNLGLLARLRLARGALSPIEAVLAAAGAHQVWIRIRQVLLLVIPAGVGQEEPQRGRSSNRGHRQHRDERNEPALALLLRRGRHRLLRLRHGLGHRLRLLRRGKLLLRAWLRLLHAGNLRGIEVALRAQLSDHILGALCRASGLILRAFAGNKLLKRRHRIAVLFAGRPGRSQHRNLALLIDAHPGLPQPMHRKVCPPAGN